MVPARLFVPASHYPHGDLPFAFFDAMRQRVPMRAINIGDPMIFGTRWAVDPTVWSRLVPTPFVNVVCANLLMQTGAAFCADDVGGSSPLAAVVATMERERDARPGAGATPVPRSASPGGRDTVYTPRTVFGAMWTAATRNVAVVLPTPASPPAPAQATLADLEQYDYIIPLGMDLQLRERRLDACTVEYAADLIADLCEVIEHRMKDY